MKLTEYEIELFCEKYFDKIDRKLMMGIIDREEYSRLVRVIDDWAQEQTDKIEEQTA